MASKYRTGDNAFGSSDVGSSKGITGAQGLDSALAIVSNKIAQNQPKASRDVRVINTPNGTIISPINRARRSKTVSSHPWLVTLSDGVATILEGKIFKSTLDPEEITPTLIEDGVSDGDLVCLELTITDGEVASIQSIVVAEADYEPFTDDGEDPPVILTTVQFIAKIIDVDGTLTVEQVARNNYAVTDICKDGKILKFLLAK